MHTDAADMGFGGTLDIAESPGDPGQWQDQGIWEWKDRAECISVRELKAIRMVLMGTLREGVKKEGITLLRLCVVLCAAKDETSVEFMRPLLNSWAECSVVISC
jgi:hypothetical protein